MKQKSGPGKAPAEQVLKDIRRQTRRHYSAEEKIRIVLEGLRGEENISELCRREGIAASMYYGWSKEFLEAGKRRLAGDTARAATSGEVKDLRREATALKEVVADLTLENRLLKKTYGAPRSQVVSTSWPNQSASTYPVSGSILPAKMEIRASWS
jgi:transposase